MSRFIVFAAVGFLLANTVQAQQVSRVYQFNNIVSHAIGDLNKDGLADSVIVRQDTTADIAPYLIEVYFQNTNKQYKLITYSQQLIIPQYPNGRDGYQDGTLFENVSIEKGVLWVNTSLLRGHFTHKFRYQNNGMELIGFTDAQSNGHGIIYATDFNLSTGNRIVTEENYETDKIISKKVEKKLIRPLPRLEDVIPYSNELY